MTKSAEKPRETDSASKARPDAKTALREAVREIRRLRSELDKSKSESSGSVAVVSMACRLPGGVDSPESYLSLLREGRGAIRPVPAGRWNEDGWLDASEPPDQLYTSQGGYLDEIAAFDPDPFGISPREAKGLDPQQRLLLEVTLEALERAGLASRLQHTDTGVYVGMSTDDYAHLSSHSLDSIDPWNSLGTMRSVAAGRIAYTFGFQGPALLFDTSCSSSLVAIHHACRDLQDSTVSTAIAGGVNLILSPRTTTKLCHLQALSPDGLCKTFDADANGYVRGEGCGVVILKRLEQAVQDNDQVLAVIRGSAINHDGKSNGLTAPNGQVQEKLIERALEQADISPEQIQYVEAHGTGTSLGDPIEVNALGRAYGRGHSMESPLHIGSVKTNIGHLEAAAGVAGFIKTVLSLQHEEFFPHLHFTDPNPHIPWERLPLAVPTELVPWATPESGRRAAISAFGMSGTNAHLILEEWNGGTEKSPSVERPYHILALSGQTRGALGDLVDRYDLLLDNSGNATIDDICSATNTGRLDLDQRAAFIAPDKKGMREALREWSAGPTSIAHLPNSPDLAAHPKVGFLFTGQGSQYQSMGRELYGSDPAFTETLDQCDAVLSPVLGRPIRSIVDDAPELLNQTRYTQPILFSYECALYKLWESWGITPHAVLGHSLGEYAAAWAAGVFDLETGLELIVERARLMQSMPGSGGMAAVLAPESRVREILKQVNAEVEIAALNGPAHVVISGDKPSVQTVASICETENIGCKLLEVSHAFHSSQMDGMLSDYEGLAEQLDFRDPVIPMVSNLKGNLFSQGDLSAQYWSAHTRRAVRFEDGVHALEETGCQLFLEIGPRPVLLGMARSIITTPDTKWLPSLRPGVSDWKQLLQSLAELYEQGVPVDFESVDRGYGGAPCTLPTYPFQRRRFWLDTADHVVSTDHDEQSIPGHTAERNLYTVEWVPAQQMQSESSGSPSSQESADHNPAREKAWLAFTSPSDEAGHLAALLHRHGQRGIEVSVGKTFQKISDIDYVVDPTDPGHMKDLLAELSGFELLGVFHALNLSTPFTDSTETQDLRRMSEMGCASVLHLVQALMSREYRSLPVWVITSGAHSVIPGEGADPTQSMVWGLGRVIGQEHPKTNFRFVDLDPTNRDESLQEVVALATGGDSFPEAEVALRESAVYVPRIQRLPFTPPGTDRIHGDGTYLVTGGLGGLGLETAQWLVEEGATSIALVARSLPAERTVRRLETWQKNARIELIQGDVSKPEDVDRIVSFVREKMKPLKGILHAAGVYDDRLVVDHKWELFEKVFEAKVYGTWNLHRATAEDSLDLFVAYSSAASMLGVAGLANYVTANTFLDSFADYRHSRGHQALTVCWGPWDNIGMAQRVGAGRQAHWNSMGISPLGAEDYGVCLQSALTAGVSRVGVFSADWDRYLDRNLDDSRLPQLNEVVAPQDSQSRERASLNELKTTEPERRQSILLNQVRSLASSVLEIENPNQLPTDKGLFQVGMDSLMALELVNRINHAYGCKLVPTAVFRHPTVSELSIHLFDDVLHNQLSSSADLSRAASTIQIAPDSIRPMEDRIAVVGMACRFPGGSDSPENFWKLLSEGEEGIVPYPAERWDVDAFFDPDPNQTGKISARDGGFLDHVDRFDPAFFGISPKEAISMDPQQRLLLEVSWEALERAGISPSSLRKSLTGVFVGIGQNDYAQWKLNAGNLEVINAYDGTGTGLCFAAGRISHTLGLQGPSMIVDTACSSSLVSVHLACQSLMQGECSTALAGGGHLNLSPEISVFLSRTGALSPDGRCKAFDASADGFGRGEGIGMVLLRRLSDAQADGNRILAVIRGSATNHDGPSSGLTVPNQNAQESLLRESLRRSNVLPKDVGYVEAHGTGTVLGDPIEVESLASVYGEGRQAHAPLYIGSVKSNFGHLEPAAGIAGLMKCVLSLQNGRIPKHLHFNAPNPHIPWDKIPVRVASEPVDWPETEENRYAAVSSFGMSGTNAHIILESEPSSHAECSESNNAEHLLVVSAKSSEALQALVARCAGLLEQGRVTDLVDFCTVAAIGRDHHSHRLAVIGTSADDFGHKLRHAFQPEPESGTYRADVESSPDHHVANLSLRSVARQYVSGMDIDFSSVFGNSTRCPDLFPTYPFQRSRFWVDGTPFGRAVGAEEKLYYGLDWQPVKPETGNQHHEVPTTWIVLEDRNGVGDAFAEVVGRTGCQVTSLCGESSAESLAEKIIQTTKSESGPVGIVCPCLLDSTEEDVLDSARRHIQTVVGIARHLLVEKRQDFRLWIVTQGAQPIHDAEHLVGLHTSSLWGLGKSFALECPKQWGGIVDLDPQETPVNQATELWRIIGEGYGDTQFVQRDGVTSVPSVVRLPAPSQGSVDIHGDATYMISGGLGALGFQTARWLASKGARNLVLFGRQGLSDSAQASIEDLTHQGVRVLTPAVDVTDEVAVRALFDQISSDLPPLKGIIHAAGTRGVSPLTELREKDVREVLEPKVNGATVLDALSRDMDLDFFVLYSSIASVWGSKGQLHYAAANSFLDALASDRRSRKLPANTVSWGLLGGMGMVSESDRLALAQMGIASLTDAQITDTLDRVIGGPHHVAVANVDWSRLRVLFESTGNAALVSRIAISDASTGGTRQRDTSPFLKEWCSTSEEGDRIALTREFVDREVKGTMGMHDDAELEADVGFFEMGMDSMMAVDLKRRLEESLRKELPATVAFDHPTSARLTEYLGALLSDTQGFPQPMGDSDPSDITIARSPKEAAMHPNGDLSSDGSIQDRLERLEDALKRV